MVFKKKIHSFRHVLVIFMMSLLLSCATTYQGDGIVIEQQKFSVAHAKKTDVIQERTTQAGLIGATSGAAVGGAFGLLGAVLAPSVSAIGWTVAGASAGALLSGGAGLLLGGGLGLVQYGLTPSESDVWQYKVKSLNGPQTFIINQKAPLIPLHANVQILEKKGVLLIKPH